MATIERHQTSMRVDRDVPPGRALHLIDVENLAGGPRVSPEVAGAALAHFLTAARPGRHDLTRLACNPWLYRVLAFDLPSGWWTGPGHGADGADRRLLDGLEPEWVRRRFDRLVVGSGDHCFAELAEGFRALGGDTWVVSRPRGLSAVLARAASRVLTDNGALVLPPSPGWMTAADQPAPEGDPTGRFASR